MRSGRCDDIVPLLGYYIQRATKKKELTVEEKRQRGFYGFYKSAGRPGIQHRWLVLAGSFLFFADWGPRGLAPEAAVLS